MVFTLAALAVASSVPPLLISAEQPQINVAVVIGAQTVPLGVAHRFDDSASLLPRPGELQTLNAHDTGHGGHTYCYRFRTRGGEALLELFDSEFGLHTARMTKVAGRKVRDCPKLAAEPRFVVGSTHFSLRATKALPPAGFRATRGPEGLSFEREWTQSGAPAACVSRSISIDVEPSEGAVRAITVQNWEEPGC